MRVATVAVAMIALTSTANAETFDDRWKGMFRVREANNSARYVETDRPVPVLQKPKMSMMRVTHVQRNNHHPVKQWRSRRTVGTTVSSAVTLKSILWPF